MISISLLFYLLSVFSFQCDQWDDHLFHRDAAVLERVAIVGNIVVVVVGIGQEGVARGKHISGAYIWRGQKDTLGVFDGKHVATFTSEVASQLLAQIGVGIAIANDFHRCIGANAAVVGGQHDATVCL